MLRQMSVTAAERSAEGPVYLGYRLGLLQSNSRIFRALVYNKSAVVLHMLRRLIGDEAFFNGLRRFYNGSRYEKASTEDLRFAMEWESGRSLERFMDRWIHGSTLPNLTFSHRVEAAGSGQELVLRFEQVGEVFDVPVTVTVEYADRRSADVLVALTEQSVEARIPLDGVFRSVSVETRDGTLAEVRRVS
jgi:aminopeptidase N